MLKLEEIQRGGRIDGLSPAGDADVISVDWLGEHQLEVTFRTSKGLDQRILQRSDEAHLRSAAPTAPFSFEGDAEDFRLAAEARRIGLAHLFDPYLALTNSQVEPLPLCADVSPRGSTPGGRCRLQAAACRPPETPSTSCNRGS